MTDGFHNIIPDSGSTYADKYQYFHSHWQGHVGASREAILQGAAQATGSSVTILGAGDCKEIPLVELLHRFEFVNLVDVDEPSLARVIATLSTEQQQRVRIIIKDLTGGAMQTLTEAAVGIIERSSAAGQACQGLIELYETIELKDSVADDWRDLQSGYVVTSVVASQLLQHPEHWIGQQFKAKFDKSPGELQEYKYAKAKLELLLRMFAQHARLIAWLAQGGLAYWSCDVRQELVMGKLSPPHAQQLGLQMTEYLRGIDWRVLKPKLAVDPQAGGHFTAYLTAQIGKQLLPVSLELEIIEYMVSAAQALDPGVTLDLVGGELEGFFAPGLEPVGEKSTWLWHIYPSNFYRGGVHQVEAWLLRSLI
ncbi:MAG: hypothetical protein V7711_16190 [Pseudomonadales bacterium]